MNILKVFISHAADAERECKNLKEIINTENKNHFLQRGYDFSPFCYKDITPGHGLPQEEKIDPEIVNKQCVLLIFIIKNSIGTIRNGETGIEHEYELGKKCKKEMKIYRCDFLIHPTEIDIQQLQLINNFFFGRIGNDNLYRIAKNTKDFVNKFRTDFAIWAEQFIRDNGTNLLRDTEDFNRIRRGF